MSKEELRKILDTAGVEYDKRFGEKKLQSLVDGLEKKVQLAVEDVTEMNKPTLDETLEITTRIDGEPTTKNGIVIPATVLPKLSRTKYFYRADCTSEECAVIKVDRRNKEHQVRVYSKERHGENFKQLAEMFVDKNNK